MGKNSKIGTHGTETEKKKRLFSTYVFHHCNCTAMVTYYLKDQKVMTHVHLKKPLPHQSMDQKNTIQVSRQSSGQHMLSYVSK